MKIQEIYNQYKIMPSLQIHMLRVAALAQIIGENITGNLDIDSVIEACLMHDMGNIIKFDLGFLPEFLEPEGLDYRKKVQNDFVDKYGSDEHVATLSIAQEVGVSDLVISLIKEIGFSKAKDNFESNKLEYMLGSYSDTRITPFGILSLEEAANEGKKRWINNKKVSNPDYAFFDECLNYLEKSQQRLFSLCRINPQNINNSLVEKRLDLLRMYEIYAKPL